MAWMKLERGNDWGADYLALPGKAKDAGGFCSMRYGIEFPDGAEMRVRWPDGTETKEVVKNKTFSFSVNDMGHEYKGTYKLAGFDADVRGAKQWMPLDVAEVWIES